MRKPKELQADRNKRYEESKKNKNSKYSRVKNKMIYPEKDGSKRSVKEYAGGGKTGYSMIGMERPMMMYGGKMKKYEDGGKALKPVDSNKNPGLSKLPQDVRNKMGYMKEGGKTFKPHSMYKDGKVVKANTYAKHLELKKKGFTHSKNKK